MNLFIDTATNKFVTSPYDSTPILSINATRGDVMPFEVGFIQDGSLLTMSGYNFSVGFKQGGGANFSGAYLAYASAFSIDTGQQFSPLYTTYLSLANTGIDSLFTGATPVKLIGQLSYGISGLSEISSFSLGVNLYDDINKPSGSYPDNSFVSFPAYITGGTGIKTSISGKTLVVNCTVSGGGGSSYSPYSYINGSFTGVVGTTYATDLTHGSFTGYMPVNPSNGDWFKVIDLAKKWGTNTLVMGTTGNFFIDYANQTRTSGPYDLNAVPYDGQGTISFVYFAAITGWSVN